MRNINRRESPRIEVKLRCHVTSPALWMRSAMYTENISRSGLLVAWKGESSALPMPVVGQILTIDAQPGGAAPQENVTITAVNYLTDQITFTAANAHAAGFSITESQSQTLQAYYSSFVAKLGVDVQTAVTGNQTQTSLTNNIDQVRQSIDGINVDEETQNLIKYQNAYAAAAHVISVMNTLLGLDVNMGIGSTF